MKDNELTRKNTDSGDNIKIIRNELTEDSSDAKRENTRSKIATIYIYAFFSTILLMFVIGLIKCFSVKDYIDFLIAVSGVLSGPLGFIIGYYFKSNDNK